MAMAILDGQPVKLLAAIKRKIAARNLAPRLVGGRFIAGAFIAGRGP
jgi:hypothetical protein